jgi:hypothetical protein
VVVRGHRGAALILSAFVLATVAGCTSAPPGSGSPSSAEGQAPSASAGAPPTEESGPPPEEETGDQEEPATGDSDTVSVEFAGLPIGGGEVTRVDDTWCQVVFWGRQVPAGVVLEIQRVVIGPEGGTVVSSGCMDAAPCRGSTISTQRPEQGCSLRVRPPDPEPDLVTVRVDGVARCPDVATCEPIVAEGGFWLGIANPGTQVPELGPDDLDDLDDPDDGDPGDDVTSAPPSSGAPAPGSNAPALGRG